VVLRTFFSAAQIKYVDVIQSVMLLYKILIGHTIDTNSDYYGEFTIGCTTMDINDLLPYKVGALMYVPALNCKVIEKLSSGAFSGLNSLAFCLEDSLVEGGVNGAEAQLIKTLEQISKCVAEELPLFFIRVRSSTQFERICRAIGDLINILTGVIFPKFDLSNADEYLRVLGDINAKMTHKNFYFMPILESGEVIQLSKRESTLLGLRKLVDSHKNYALNIRVGAMDFCKPYGLRRAVDQTIYDISVVRDVLTDILNVFSNDYVVAAPVWEYFDGRNGSDDWRKGMENELKLDIANGFIGKTIIHPSQIHIVTKWLSPTIEDVNDAKAILDWKDNLLGVAKGLSDNRMNELATHQKWARKILILAEIYGVRRS